MARPSLVDGGAALEPRPGETAREKVVIVDDDHMIRAALRRALGRLGYEVVEANNGETGLALIASAQPEVVITDLRMPGVDGHTLLRRLAALPASPGVVAISASGTMEDVIEVLRWGAVDYLKKPWTPAELAAA